ncbi:putative Dol-P-Glc:Glc(2)Man(9)GlcNAc(2)-PP-Dol alpha-1,2-glucosyltransferase [Copidosoma floridanum]|uniref:putative Dol-P-Glc:Glc(2)Man(9)GlcNAc(2)-PP-Dol alpha-1,2-glucosyltransferase n=1 Tax=Copidosoma floridanum TaxID=29053 RepID=UPI0006C9463B|nr:putative Dol-P-Glc:Glc(2)Man(9)GlcNAc(2)-PP-Dol alpha-1,2-glucosyltransferase [Copidosoma floridanum]
MAKKMEVRKTSSLLNTAIDALLQILAHTCGISLSFVPLLFTYLNITQKDYFIDEKFHVPQTIQYCNGNFFEWDQKITTLPGLYLFAAAILGPFKFCTITHLRLLNVFFTYINVWLAYLILNKQRREKVTKQEENLRVYSLFLRAWNIAFFPPLFFWFFLYYTDVFSVTLILLMFLCYISRKDKSAAFVGLLTICVRQTNVIWVAYIGIERGFDAIDQLTKKPQYTNTLNLFPCIKTLFGIFRAKARHGTVKFLQFTKSFCMPFIHYLLVLIAFAVFVTYNNGIVVGDRSAHKPTIHAVQIFYFSMFVIAFAWPYLLPYISKPLELLSDHIVASTCIIGVIVHHNTLVHPYILADNRHYSFYVWKNLMNRYHLFKYLLVPMYAFALHAILKSISHMRKLSILSLAFCTCAVLVPQLLLEPRYFIIPYILYRLQLKEPKHWQLVAETVTIILVNIFQFYLFTSKSFSWADEKHPQRIAW